MYLLMAAKEWEKLLHPKYKSDWTKTSIFKGENLLSPVSSSIVGLGNSFKTASTSSGVHLARIFASNWLATAVPGRLPAGKKKIELI